MFDSGGFGFVCGCCIICTLLGFCVGFNLGVSLAFVMLVAVWGCVVFGVCGFVWLVVVLLCVVGNRC